MVFDGFRAADYFEIAAGAHQEFSAAKLAVVIETHGVAVGAGVVDDNGIPYGNFRQ